MFTKPQIAVTYNEESNDAFDAFFLSGHVCSGSWSQLHKYK